MKICCDRDKAALDRVGNDKVIKTSDYSDIVKDAEVDAVVVATPSETHAELALKALSAGSTYSWRSPWPSRSGMPKRC
jgi:predicted dehydrogenase